jgi:hypothetical protein
MDKVKNKKGLMAFSLALFLAGCGSLMSDDSKTNAPVGSGTAISPTDASLFPIAMLTIQTINGSESCMAGYVSGVLVTAAHCVAELSESACSDGTISVYWTKMNDGVPNDIGTKAACSSVVADETGSSANDLAFLRLADTAVRPTFSLRFVAAPYITGDICLFGSLQVTGPMLFGSGAILGAGEMITHRAASTGGFSGTPALACAHGTDSTNIEAAMPGALSAGIAGIHVGVVSGLASLIPALRVQQWLSARGVQF